MKHAAITGRVEYRMADAASKPTMPRPASRRRRLIVVLSCAVAALVIGRLALGLWGGSRLDALVRETAPEWDAERARLAALKHPWDPAATAPCGPAYLDAAVDLREASLAVSEAVGEPPRVKVRPEARAVVEAQRPVIDAFLRASGCGSYAPRPGEAWAPFDRSFRVFTAARLVVLDARLRVEAGDPAGALDRLLAVAKAGTDLGEGAFIDVLIGGAMVSAALETLAPLVADGRLAAADRDRAERALAALAPRMPAMAAGLARERLFLRWAALEVRGGKDAAQMRSLEGEGAPSWSALPESALFAESASAQLAFLREAEAIVARERDPDALRAALEAAEPKGTLDRWVGLGVPAAGLASQARNMCVPSAWEKLAGAALAIAKGTKPEDLAAAPIPDPCGTGDIEIAATIDGRTSLSSVGKDGKRGGDDLRIETAAPAARTESAPAAGAEAAGAAAAIDERASLAFVRDGKAVRDVPLGDLLRDVKEETFTAYDPYYGHEKTFRALPLADVVRRGFAGVDAPLPDQQYVLRARDGYTVPMPGAKVFEAGAYLAFADEAPPGWEPIGPRRADPGPFYLVWRGAGQQDLESYPRPWQLASIEIARFEDLFPHTVPEGLAEGSPAMRGFAIFRENCIHCHAVNREGGRVGPDLNVPKSIIEYRPVEQIQAYIRDPMSFRYGTMPAHPSLKQGDLDDLIAYFGAMKDRKHDPSAKGRGGR